MDGRRKSDPERGFTKTSKLKDITDLERLRKLKENCLKKESQRLKESQENIIDVFHDVFLRFF